MNRFLLMSEETGGDVTSLGGEPAAAVVAPPVPAAVPAADGNWYDSLPQDMREDQNITKFDSMETMAKSWQNAQRMIGAEKIPMPQTDDDYSAVYKRLGCPDSADLYQVTAPEGVEINEDMQNSYKTVAHELGLSQKQMDGLASWQFEQEATSSTASTEASQAALDAATNSLKSEWGEAHEQNVNLAARAASEFMGEEGVKFFNESMIDGVPAGEHPGLLKLFHSVAKGMMESSKIEGIANEGKQTPQEIEDSRNALMNNPAYLDNRHPEHAAVMRKVQESFKLQFG